MKERQFKISSMLFLLLFLPLLLPSTYAYISGDIGLLTVSEADNDTELGGVANLQLVVKPGSGRIFIDSFPLSKIDTQITFRFAAEMACDMLERDCSGYDFFYTITANTGLVGGPSAGAAATVLTVALLDSQMLDNKTIMTGTINSGNLIGPVAGVPAKALAAQVEGYTRILIPEWDVVNNTPNENLSIEVIPVSTLEESLYYFTGKDYSRPELNVPVYSSEYSDMMRNITVDLCTKYGSITDGVLVMPNLISYNISVTNYSQDNFLLASNAINTGSYYSAASLCFSGNVKIRSELLKNFTDTELKILYAKSLSDVNAFMNAFENDSKSLSTISELETYIIVSERLHESKELLSKMNPENISRPQLAYAIERFYTAIVWSEFSSFPGPKFEMDNDLLMVACGRKMAEAEERLNYLELYYPGTDIREELQLAYSYYLQTDYPLCIFTSSKVKADADLLLSAIFVPDTDLDRLFAEKISAAQRVINKQKESGIFPILGYSYYEYALTLKDTDQYSGLLYAEYSLELSNIDMYFKKHEPLTLSSGFNLINFHIYTFILGVLVGIIMASVIFVLLKRSRRKGRKTRK
ncbi:MAG: S16 family serine protease [Candidatus Woesearchaeota archaeon]